MITPFIHLGTEYGDVEIRKKDLSLIHAADLKKFRITRAELRRCFAEAMELMKGATQEDWAKRRPVCAETRDGKWEVHGPVGYNQYTHPLMGDDYKAPKGTEGAKICEITLRIANLKVLDELLKSGKAVAIGPLKFTRKKLAHGRGHVTRPRRRAR